MKKEPSKSNFYNPLNEKRVCPGFVVSGGKVGGRGVIEASILPDSSFLFFFLFLPFLTYMLEKEEVRMKLG